MKIPDNAIIPDEKLTSYLLVPKARNDKSKFLAQAGFTSANPETLKASIQELAVKNGYQLKPGQVDCARDWSVVTKKTF